MARKSSPIDPNTPYHIGSRCINRDWFSLPTEEVWEMFSHQLFFISHAYQINIHAFTLMSNHFHLIAKSPRGNMSEALAYLLRETSRELTKKSDRINRTWGGRYFRTRLGSFQYYCHAYKYLYRNPVEASLSKNVEDYPFSTLNGLLGRQQLIIPMAEDTLLFDSPERTLLWLNTSPLEKDRQAIRSALRRQEFKLVKDVRTRRGNQLETRAY